MPPKVPSYRLHKASGQAFAQLKGRRIYLGKHGTPESEEKYSRFVAELLVSPHSVEKRAIPHKDRDSVLMVQLIPAYWTYAQTYYTRNGRRSGWLVHIRLVLRTLRALYGSTPADEFGPLALKALRQKMIDEGKSRKYINKLVAIIPRMFKWAAGEELVPGSVYVDLQTVEGLRKGRTIAPEHPPVEPVTDAVIEATIPYLSPIIGDMVRLQRLTGARPGEICSIRSCDIDRSDEVWIYRPTDHKMAYKDHERIIYLGPQAQDIVRPYLLRPIDAYCFSPIESESRRKASMRMNRKSRVQPSQINRQKTKPKRKPKDHYTKDSYRRAITRGIEKANKILANGEKLPHWHPHQIRHAVATQIRRDFGLEASQIVLGHRNARITEIYAQRDEQRGIDIAKQIG